MVQLTGDMHGDAGIRKFSTKNFSTGKDLTKSDYLIVLGDFGLVWYPEGHDKYKQDQYWVNWLENQPWTTLFLDGNHENFDILDELPEMDMFGGRVGKLADSIYHLKRGEIYSICGDKYFVMGGALSTDKDSNPNRIPGVGWWEREIPSTDEFEHGISNLNKHNWNVDYVLTHNCPTTVGRMYTRSVNDKGDNILKSVKNGGAVALTGEQLSCLNGEDVFSGYKVDEVSTYLDGIFDKIQFKKWYFGHWHDNWISSDEKFVMLYGDIVPLGTTSEGL
jgi:hypothetical protein